MPDSTIKLFGHEYKKQTVFIASGAVVVAGGAYYFIRRRNAANAQSAANAAQEATTNANNIDPATGYPYGSPQDEAALAGMNESEYETDTLGDIGNSGAGEIIGYDSDGNPIYGSGTSSDVVGFTTNAEWGQYAEEYLGSTGSDSIAAAIAKYLSGQPLTTAQITVVQEAIAIAGTPPVAGENGNPPNYVTAPANTTTTTTSPAPPGSPNPGGPATGTGGGTTTTTSGSTVQRVNVPNVVGMRADTARQTLRQANLKYNISDNATGTVTATHPAAGAYTKVGTVVAVDLKS
jgi:PASTA domain